MRPPKMPGRLCTIHSHSQGSQMCRALVHTHVGLSTGGRVPRYANPNDHRWGPSRIHSTAQFPAAIRMISFRLRKNPFHTCSTDSLTCSALPDTWLAKWRCFRTENRVSAASGSGLQGGCRSKERLDGTSNSFEVCHPAHQGRRARACPQAPPRRCPGDDGSSPRCWPVTAG